MDRLLSMTGKVFFPGINITMNAAAPAWISLRRILRVK